MIYALDTGHEFIRRSDSNVNEIIQNDLVGMLRIPGLSCCCSQLLILT